MIVNVTSSVTLKALSIYTASKAAVNAFSDSVALELEPFGVRVHVVLPGRAPDTAFAKNAGERMSDGFPEPYAAQKGIEAEALRRSSDSPALYLHVPLPRWLAMTKLLLAGATGLVGTAALKLLLADERVTRVVAPTRRALSPHPKLLNPIADSTDIPYDADWWVADGAISALGTTRAKSQSAAAYRAIDHDYPLAIATQVRKSGATRFALTSSMGADARSRFRYTRTKGELEDAIDRLGFQSLTILRPGFLGGEREEDRPVERILGPLLRIAAPVLPAGARTSPASTVAALLVEGALGGSPGRHVIGSAEIARAAEGRH